MSNAGKGGGRGTNQHAIRGQSATADTVADPSMDVGSTGAERNRDPFRSQTTDLVGQMTDAATLDHMSRHDDFTVRMEVASSRHVSTATLDRLLRDDNEYVRGRAASNVGATDEQVAFAAEDESAIVRGHAACNTSDQKLLERLSRDRSWMVRAEVGKNPDTHPEVLHRLVDDRHESVGHAVLDNPSANEVMVDRLGSHTSPTMRFAVATHPRTAPWTLERLAHEPHREVRLGARRQEHAPPSVRLVPARLQGGWSPVGDVSNDGRYRIREDGETFVVQHDPEGNLKAFVDDGFSKVDYTRSRGAARRAAKRHAKTEPSWAPDQFK